MANNSDCPGLIDSLDRVIYDNVPLVLDKLTDLSELGWYDTIISYGALPKISYILEQGNSEQKRNSAILIYSLLTHGRVELVLSVGGIMKGMIDLMDEREDEGLQRCIAYSMSVMVPMADVPRMIEEGVIDKLSDLLSSDDDMTVLYSLNALHTFSMMGYQSSIIDAGVPERIKYHMEGDFEGSLIAKQLLDDLYDWEQACFIIDEEELEIIPDTIEVIGFDDGYIRPRNKKARIEPRDGKIHGIDGEEIPLKMEKGSSIPDHRIEREDRDGVITGKIVDDLPDLM